jgi:hypothetical protein
VSRRTETKKTLKAADKKAAEIIESKGLTGDQAEMTLLKVKCWAIEGLLWSLSGEIDKLNKRLPNPPTAD